MASTSYHAFSDSGGASIRRRPTAFLLALAIHVLLLLMLFRLAPPLPPFTEMRGKPLTVQLLPEQRIAATRGRAVAKAKSASRGASPPRLPPRPTVPPTPAPPLEPPRPAIELIPLTRQELATTDAVLLRSNRPGRSQGAEAGSGEDSASSGAGEAPGGERLYNADWYRKPTHAELATYLPPRTSKTGWGMIACQTVEGYRVDNCRELGQSPLGSGLASAVRQAAWQFRVLPPRIGGRPIIGAWVRIRIEFSEGAVN